MKLKGNTGKELDSNCDLKSQELKLRNSASKMIWEESWEATHEETVWRKHSSREHLNRDHEIVLTCLSWNFS